MKSDKIAKDNYSFFCVAVGMAMCSLDFTSAVLHSFDEPAQYGVETSQHSGYIRVDSTDIKDNFSHGGFADEVRGRRLLSEVARELVRSVKGELYNEAGVVVGIYKFSFKISKYERDGKHGFEMVDDPSSLPNGEKLGRLVDLKITMQQ